MPTTDTQVNNLIINKLTKQQYESIQNPSETELYLVPDEIDSTPTSGSDNPVTSGGVYTALQEKGVPAGGTTGQVLAKHSNTDNDLEWTDQIGGYNFAFEIVGNNLQVTYGDSQNPNFSITNDHLIVTL